MPAEPAHRPVPPIAWSELAAFPLPGCSYPVQAAFGPDERVLTFLHDPDGGLARRLFVLDLDAERAGPGAAPVEVDLGGGVGSESELSRAEQLRRERNREIFLGVTSATWAGRADALLVPLPDGLRVVRGLAADPAHPEVVLVCPPGDGETLAPALSPDGTMVAFVRGGDLHVVDVRPGATARRLTTTATDGLTNGLAEFVAEEEMDRSAGLWWSPDSRLVAFAEVDEREIPLYRIIHQGSDTTGPEIEERHRYPFAGADNASVRLLVVPADGGEPRVLDGGESAEYLARVDWTGPERLAAQLVSRDQTRLDLVEIDASTGARRVLLADECHPYLNLHDDFRPLEGGGFLWSSERTGYRHLERRDADGDLVAVLTAGSWQVDRLEGLDEAGGRLWFSGTLDGDTERHLYAVPLAGGEPRKVTGEAGTHHVVVGERSGRFVDLHSSLERPPTVRLCSLADGGALATLHDRRDPRIDAIGIVPPEKVVIDSGDGPVLAGLLFRTPVEGSGPPPLVLAPYGGPHLQLASDEWARSAALRAQLLARLGANVLVVDGRGTSRRGLAFESATYLRMGELEVADQVRAVEWAVANGLADPARVGIYGWSYGGFLTLRCLGTAPEVFAAGVAGAPVTHFDGYDTFYTERYMSTPDANRQGYDECSALACAGQIRGALMIVHGLVDENVHFRHTARLVNRLVAAQVPHRLLCFPDERHLPRKAADRAYLEEEVVTFLAGALGLPIAAANDEATGRAPT